MRGDSGQPVMAESEGRRATAGRPRGALPILLGIVAGVAICALVYFGLTLTARPTPDPAPTARALCADLSSQRYSALYGMLSTELQSQGTEAQFVASQRELDSLLGPVHTCQATITSNSGGAAGVSVTLQRGQVAALHAQAALTLAQGGWRIASYDQHI